MNIGLKAKYRHYADDSHLTKKNRAGGARGHGSYSARTGNSHGNVRRWAKGVIHPIGLTAGAGRNRK